MASVKEQNFFICVYLDSEKSPLGHSVSQSNDFPPEMESEAGPAKDDDEHEDKISSFSEIFQRFKDSMFAYIDILPVMAGAAPFATWMIRSKNLIDLLNSECVVKHEEENRIVYELKEEFYSTFKELNEAANSLSLIGKQVPKMLIIGIVSSYEYYSSILIREIYKSNAGMIEGSDKSVSIKDIFLSKNIEEFKELLIDKEVEDVMRRSFADQIKWFESNLGLKRSISDEYSKWGGLIEIFERRNLFAHANGIVGKRYLDKTKNLGNRQREPSRGQELYAGPKYFKKSIENITEFGLKLIQVVWRKLYPAESDKAYSSASDFAFELIAKGEYFLSSEIYLFLDSLNGKKDGEQQLINTVNLANCYALLKDDKKRDDILAQHEWSAINDRFSVSIAAVKKYIKQVIQFMNKLKYDYEWNETNYEEWPVFFQIRNDEDFIKCFEELYGRPFSPKPEMRNSIKSLEAHFLSMRKKIANSAEVEHDGKSLH
ncbi:hypothetical protein J2Y63_003429 [Shinella sp. BE166]|uniref:hypothetical protein n=1 Tax=Shinella sp. BE166 TaxID=3373918 RepID=UPI003EBF152B